MNSPIRKIAAAALLALAAIVNQASAIPISGEITFSGGTINMGTVTDTGTTNALLATQILSYGAPAQVVNTDSGSYAGTTGDTVTFSTFKFSDAGVVPLWTFTVGALTYSFNATSILNGTILSNFLNLSGTGTAFITGAGSPYDATAGQWSLTSTTSSTIFTFGASTSVPDSGTTAMLIGVGLTGIVLASRSFKRKTVKA